MDLYIEGEFLDNFYLDFDEKPIQIVVKRLITEFGNKRVFTDSKEEDFKQLMESNPFFDLIYNTTPPVSIESIENHLFSKSSFSQTIVFTNKPQPWTIDADKKGALCFNFDDYSDKINNIINKLHFKIDLSQELSDWGFLNSYQYLNFNTITISDNYILTDKSSQKIDKNLIEILKAFQKEKKGSVNINILTKEIIGISPNQQHKKEKAKKIISKLNRVFANNKSHFKIIINDIINGFNFHDRNITTNFSIIDCGEGFNLFPFKASNSQIISETIFEKYTYDRLKNIKKSNSDYIKKLANLETVKFKMYPEK